MPSPFLTWLGLCRHSPETVVRQQIERRIVFLDGEIEREHGTLQRLDELTGPTATMARLMTRLAVCHFEAERRWLEEQSTALIAASSHD